MSQLPGGLFDQPTWLPNRKVGSTMAASTPIGAVVGWLAVKWGIPPDIASPLTELAGAAIGSLGAFLPTLFGYFFRDRKQPETKEEKESGT